MTVVLELIENSKTTLHCTDWPISDLKAVPGPVVTTVHHRLTCSLFFFFFLLFFYVCEIITVTDFY